MKLGSARSQAPTAWRLVTITVAKDSATFSYQLDRDKLRQARRREGRYLLRTNLAEDDLGQLWRYYLSWSRWNRHSKASRATSPSGRSLISRKRASRRISSSPSWPMPCT